MSTNGTNDLNALAAYQAAMPGYDIIGLTKAKFISEHAQLLTV
jgi:hypothetical protein